MMHRKIFIVIMLIFSCNTIRDIDDKQIYYVPSESISKHIEDNNFEFALSSYYNLRNNGFEMEQDILDLRDKALSGIQNEYLNLCKSKDYEGALFKLETLNLFGIMLNESKKQLILKHLESLRHKDPMLASFFAKYYLFDNNFDFLQNFVIHEKSPSKNVLLDTAVLTVWVDMGTKIVNGNRVPNIALGSSFVIDNLKGYALTNYHVISSQVNSDYNGVSNLYVKLPRGKGEKLPAEVISYSKEMDLALIKVSFKLEHQFNLDYSANINIGDRIYAMGSPLGFEKTITSGIISGKNRNLLSVGDSYQIDAAINQGNSGGPVINENGGFVGLTFAGFVYSQGLNFVIPSKWVLKVLPFMYRGGVLKNNWLGFTFSESLNNLEISYVVPNSPADIGGLRSGDSILSVNSLKFDSLRELQYYILQRKSMVSVKYKRNNKEYESYLYPQNRPENIFESIINRDSFKNVVGAFLGLNLSFIAGKEYRVAKVFANGLGDELNFRTNDEIFIYDLKYIRDKRVFILLLYVKRLFSGYLGAPLQLIIPFDSIIFV
ncbi:trypsin-like serine protease, typically periplasmic, contain C-terminal PDZ domain [Borrelia recurrentis A1]|uniref:Trypsin-like serine protease, typically periplasmic, contain C-terminal PDZ domain n=2 Tax=Borrelia recurrentis TaxID=44449 RepID=B5RQC8_BORRA|nr:trypsin-like serine protease, typically periplasmic, contain C-terminal PDZ domain [Borrelia recurrentis A1]